MQEIAFPVGPTRNKMIHPRSLFHDDLIRYWLVPGSLGFGFSITSGSDFTVWTLDGSVKLQLWHGYFFALGRLMKLGPFLSVLKDDIFLYQVYNEKLMKINLPSTVTFKEEQCFANQTCHLQTNVF